MLPILILSFGLAILGGCKTESSEIQIDESAVSDLKKSLEKCDEGETLHDGLCVLSQEKCDIENGMGVKNWTGTEYGACQAVKCNEEFHVEQSQCVSDARTCTLVDGQGRQIWDGKQWGVCEPFSCSAGYHKENGKCELNVQTCDVSNGKGSKVWQGTDYSACVVESCNSGFHLEANQCQADTQVCIVPNGSGTKKWNGTGYNACIVSSCEPNYKIENNQCVIINTCDIRELDFEWPLDGEAGVDWAVESYVDLDKSTGGLRDYRGNTGTGSLTNDNQTTTDIAIGSLRSQAKNKKVFAVEDGVVEFVRSGQDDDLLYQAHSQCPSTIQPNEIHVRHSNGYLIKYKSLSAASPLVSQGGTIKRGDHIGYAGTSGCALTPRVQIEVRNCSNSVVDPFESELFDNEPDYRTPRRVLEFVIRSTPFSTTPSVVFPQLFDPAPNITSIPRSQFFGVGMLATGWSPGDEIVLKIHHTESGFQTESNPPFIVSDNANVHMYISRWKFDKPGRWIINLYVNNVFIDSYFLRVP